MRARTWINIALLVLVGVLVLVAIYEPGKKPPAQEQPLTTLAAANIRQIHITCRDDQPITLVKEHDGWWLTAPFHIRANAHRVEALLNLLSTPSHAQYDLTKLTAAQFGLDKPRAEVSFDGTRIAFGGSDPLHHQRYVRLGSTLHLVTDSLTYYLLARASSFVDPAPLSADARPIGFALPDVVLDSKDGHWHATPSSALHSTDQVTRLIDAWKHSEALEVRDYKPSAHAAHVDVTLEGASEPLRFDIVSRKPELILGRRDLGIEYAFDTDAAKQLLELGTNTAAPAPEVKPASAGEAGSSH